MTLRHLPLNTVPNEYSKQAQELLDGWKQGDAGCLEVFRTKLPRFLDERIPWLPKNLTDAGIRGADLDLADAQLAIARWYDFRDWAALAEFVEAAHQPGSPVMRFECAVESVVDGDLASLTSLLRDAPDLVRARSTRVTHFDPPVHRATLLHYVAANGVEGYRQRTPPNAVEVARVLLQAAADVDATADMYGGRCTTLSLLVSSCHPANAGLQVPLVDVLLDFGASLVPIGVGAWTSPLMTALVFGYGDAARELVRRGARVDNIGAAAGVGQADEVRRFLPAADAESRHRALALAAQNGQVEALRLLLDAGEDPNRYNPEGLHSHATPLHHAAVAGYDAAVRLLVERGARLDIKDTIYGSTPLGWAIHAGRTSTADYLRSRGA